MDTLQMLEPRFFETMASGHCLNLPHPFDIVTTYVPSASNPADNPSRGIYGPKCFFLPPISLPTELRSFLIDSTEPLPPTEIRLLRNGSYSTPAAKIINRELLRQQAIERARASRSEEEEVISRSLADDE
jgi:hypothetical protein